MADFQKAVAALFAAEGVVSHWTEDAGGFTYRGIAERFHPEWPGFALIRRAGVDAHREALDDMARHFYKAYYWWPMGLEGDDVGDAIATSLLLAAVLTNSARAVETLQDVLNGLNFDAPGRRARWPEISVDGRIGPNTRAALASATRAGYEDEILGWFDVLIKSYLWSRVKARKQNELFAAGWLRR